MVKKRVIERTPYFSRKIGTLPKGCQMCVKGEKLVLYVTGICPRHCWFCPLSEKKKDKDVVFVNEWHTDKIEDAISEARIGHSKGCGITGGDPLSRLERTISYIKAFKKEFGKKFHIHLYTSLVLVTPEVLKKLYSAGLDEIRFHPDYNRKEDWERLSFAKKFDWDVGVEIPMIPENEKEILELVDFLDGKIDFLNLNELEASDLNADEMIKRGYEMKDVLSHAVVGSDKLGLKVMKRALGKSFSVHFCSSKLKDKVQMQNRFKLRAKSVKTKYDLITDEGLLIRGVILVGDKDINETLKFLKKEGLDCVIDDKKKRILTYPEHVEQFAGVIKKLGLKPAIVEEDPTVEAYEVNVDWL